MRLIKASEGKVGLVGEMERERRRRGRRMRRVRGGMGRVDINGMGLKDEKDKETFANEAEGWRERRLKIIKY